MNKIYDHILPDRKEKPILFSTWSARRILMGAKTKTSRPMKAQPDSLQGFISERKSIPVADRDENGVFYNAWFGSELREIRHPFQGFHWLWGREMWKVKTSPGELGKDFEHKYVSQFFRFGTEPESYWHELELPTERYRELKVLHSTGEKPAIFMPRECSRLNLKITARYPQRLYNFTTRMICAEGVRPVSIPYLPYNDRLIMYRRKFAEIWDDIYSGSGYEYHENPWVWVTVFDPLVS